MLTFALKQVFLQTQQKCKDDTACADYFQYDLVSSMIFISNT